MGLRALPALRGGNWSAAPSRSLIALTTGLFSPARIGPAYWHDLGLSYGDFLGKVAEADRNNVGGVRVARLGEEGTSYDVQDHLLIIEDPPAVPEPSTLAIWSLLGLVGCAAQRRKRHRPGAA